MLDTEEDTDPGSLEGVDTFRQEPEVSYNGDLTDGAEGMAGDSPTGLAFSRNQSFEMMMLASSPESMYSPLSSKSCFTSLTGQALSDGGASCQSLDSDSSEYSDNMTSGAVMLNMVARKIDVTSSTSKPQSLSSDKASQFEMTVKDNMNFRQTPQMPRSVGSPGIQEAFHVVNAKCFEAAVREKLVEIKPQTFSLKMKTSKKVSIHHLGHKHSRSHTVINSQASNQQLPIKDSPAGALASTSVASQTTMKAMTFAMPVQQSSSFAEQKGGAPSIDLQGTTQIGTNAATSQSFGNKSEHDLRQCRYNQTSMALQQSGLMKTTVKTAELLRKSRIIQQELNKLRSETSIFVQSVLNNPQNKHLKEQFYKSKQGPLS